MPAAKYRLVVPEPWTKLPKWCRFSLPTKVATSPASNWWSMAAWPKSDRPDFDLLRRAEIRREILTVGRRSNCRLGRTRGLTRLGLKTNTLFYKTKRLGIVPSADHGQD
jgi:hypothetical protein